MLMNATVPQQVVATRSSNAMDLTDMESAPMFFPAVVAAVVGAAKLVAGTKVVAAVGKGVVVAVTGNGFKNVVGGDGFFDDLDKSIAYGIGAGFGYAAYDWNPFHAPAQTPGQQMFD
jgi:hypothetical protein